MVDGCRDCVCCSMSTYPKDMDAWDDRRHLHRYMLFSDRECSTEYHNGRSYPITSCLRSEQTKPDDAAKGSRYRHISPRRTVSTDDENGTLQDEH